MGNTKRYIILKESIGAHYSTDHTIVDTHHPGYPDPYEAEICEVYGIEKAKLICGALNNNKPEICKCNRSEEDGLDVNGECPYCGLKDVN